MTLPQAARLMETVLPRRRFNKKDVLEILRYYTKRNFVAARSHRKMAEKNMRL